MRPFRLTLAGMMALVSLVAVGFAALRGPNDAWADGLFTATLATLSLALLALLFGRPEHRPFWGGFVVVGWGYWMLAFGPLLGEQVGPRLATGYLAATAYDSFHVASGAVGDQVWFKEGRGFEVGTITSTDQSSTRTIFTIERASNGLRSMLPGSYLRPLSLDKYIQLCTSLVIPFLAYAGGVISQVIASNRDRAS